MKIINYFYYKKSKKIYKKSALYVILNNKRIDSERLIWKKAERKI